MEFKGLIVVGIMACVLGGCGGGGGGDNGYNDESWTNVSVSLSPTSISTTFSESGGTPAGVTITASLFDPPTTSVYAYITADSNVFTAGPQTVTANGNGGYSATLSFNTSVAPGTYSGFLTLKLCKDSACASQYVVSGGTLPYTVTVTP